MPFKSRFGRRLKRGVKNRYMPKHKRGGKRRVNIGKLAGDVYRIQRALNSETKFIDHALTTMSPTAPVPLLQAISTPDTQGVAGVGQRVGSKVRFTHLSAKLVVQHQNFGNIRSSQNLVFHIIWLKNGLFADDLESDPGPYLQNPDFNGEYTTLSYWNRQNYNNFISIYKCQVNMKDTQPPSQSAHGLPTDTDNVNTETYLGRQPLTQSRYITINKRISVHSEWANVYNQTPGFNTDDITRMKPYVYCYSDCTSQSVPSGTGQPTGVNTDRIFLQGTIRLSYVDN